MRLALVSPYDLSFPGGVTEHVRHLSAHLARRGHEVQLIAPASGDATVPGVRVRAVTRRVRTWMTNGSIARIAISPVAAWRVAQFLRDSRPDVVHVHEPAVPVVGPVGAFLGRAPVVATFHAARDPGWLRSPFSLVLAPLASRLAARVAVSAPARATAVTYAPGSYQIIPNGVDAASFAVDHPVPPMIAGPRPFVLYLGRLDARKGLGVLVDAFATDPALRKRARLVIAGAYGPRDAAPWIERCREAGLPDAAFIGAVSDESRVAILRHAAVACAPATGGESHGLVLLEAMAAGTPVIAAANAGYCSIVVHEVNGLLVPPGDAGALAGAIGRALDDDGLRRRLIDGGLSTARAHDWAGVVDRLEAIYATASR